MHVKRGSVAQDFVPERVGHGFACTDQAGIVAIHQHLGGSGAGVVVAGHGHAIRPARKHRQQVARRTASARSRPSQSPLQIGPTTS